MNTWKFDFDPLPFEMEPYGSVLGRVHSEQMSYAQLMSLLQK